MDLTITGIERDLKSNCRNERVRGRLFALRKLCLGATQKSVGLELGISERTVLRWKLKYEKHGPSALENGKRCGRPRKKWLRGKQAQKVLAMRRKYQWGPEVIVAHMWKLEGIVVSQSQVQKLLKRKGLVRKVKRRKKNKHTKRVKIHEPGKHTQMDVRYLDDMDAGPKRYVYNFVDHASKWTFKHVYDSYGPSETKDFILQLLFCCPFTILRLQTDNGIEFTNRFLGTKEHVLDTICKERGIRHVCIPPGEKELQGLVEGHHRIDKDEFFDRIGKQNLAVTNKLLQEHLWFRNNCRGFKTNNWQSANEYLAWDAMKIFIWVKFKAQQSRPNDDQYQEQMLVAA
jgi:transposase